jgi:hypothetical protein
MCVRDTGNIKSLEEKLAERRAAFQRWKTVYINANEISISKKDTLSATVKVPLFDGHTVLW